MPDWSYRPLFAPWMLRLPRLAQPLVLAKMRLIGATPFLYKIIDLMGHMRPEEALGVRFAGFNLASPLGLGAAVDPTGEAVRAFERFGFGFLEVGPVGGGEAGLSAVDVRERSVALPPAAVTASRVATNLRPASRVGVLRFARVATTEAAEAMAHLADALIAPAELAHAARRSGKPFGLSCRLGAAARLAETLGAAFLVIDSDDGWQRPSDRERGAEVVRALHARFPEMPILYAAGGIESPADALQLRAAGATALSLSHGFLFTGPGTPKRINAALAPAPAEAPTRRFVTLLDQAQYAWFWCLLLGGAMTVGALLAAYFSMTRVILPYDEAASGVTREAILALNPKVLRFMEHDRFTLAGTMLSLGLLYAGLGWHGVRRGRIWAQEAVVYSATAGFLTFFAFLGYGYFDQFHGFVAASLLPIAIQCATRQRMRPAPLASDLDNDRAFRHAAVGQLVFVIEAAGLILAGLVIMLVGARHVFVATDLAFLGTTGEALQTAYPRLVPLIAHDRATFGGMLLSSGIAVLLTVLWGFHRGERWLWKLLFVGFFAYAATLWVHADIAYTDPLHLSPVFVGTFLHGLGLALTRRFFARH